MEWISVEDRLPDKDGKYIVYQEWLYGNKIEITYWTCNYNGFEEHLKGKSMWYNYDSEWGDYEMDDITHWMPLPENPKF